MCSVDFCGGAYIIPQTFSSFEGGFPTERGEKKEGGGNVGSKRERKEEIGNGALVQSWLWGIDVIKRVYEYYIYS